MSACICRGEDASLTGQAVVTLQLRVLHRPLLLVRQRAGLPDGRKEGGRGIGAGVRVPQKPAQPLDLQQSAVVLADRLSVLLILVALGSLALEVQRPPHDVSWFVEGWLLQHRPTMMPLLLLLLVFGVFGSAAAAAAAAAAAVGGLSALLEPRGAASAASFHPPFMASLDHAHLRLLSYSRRPKLGRKCEDFSASSRWWTRLRLASVATTSSLCATTRAPPLYSDLVFSIQPSYWLINTRASGPMAVSQLKERLSFSFEV